MGFNLPKFKPIVIRPVIINAPNPYETPKKAQTEQKKKCIHDFYVIDAKTNLLKCRLCGLKVTAKELSEKLANLPNETPKNPFGNLDGIFNF